MRIEKLDQHLKDLEHGEERHILRVQSLLNGPLKGRRFPGRCRCGKTISANKEACIGCSGKAISA